MDVLVVDDEPISRRAVAQALEAVGYRVTLACAGHEALLRLQESCIQLVVSDWIMPGMNGLDLCRAIRSADFRRYVYFVMLTSHNRPQDTLEGFEAGVDDYVVKPFNPGELAMRVNAGRRVINAESSEMTIFSLAKLAKSRDPDTGAHLERVRGYCRALALELKRDAKFRLEVDQEYVRLIYETSPLHDIGKVAIPDAVLLKPGKLTQEEFELMKTHAQRGADTLAAAILAFPNASFLRMAHDIALNHHEKYDGSGYPRGFSAGDEIPLCARIVSLADVYDALTSKRVYKAALDRQAAKDIIVMERGKHFDPRIVDAFLAIEERFVAIRAQHVEHEQRLAATRSRPAPIVPLLPGHGSDGPLAMPEATLANFTIEQ